MRFDDAPIDHQLGAQMAQRLKHRGPDQSGQWQQPDVLFGHQRLAIIDLDQQSKQPFVIDHWVLVFNGTIYNYKLLRQRLIKAGHCFRTQSDTEVVLRAWIAWGEACLQAFEGMFAFALWNQHSKTLWMVRDRFGIKPLYYSLNHQRLCFASTLPALLADQSIQSTPDPIALQHHFMLHASVPAPYTLLSDVRKLPPAHYLKITPQNAPEIKRYWHLSTAENKQLSLTDWQEATWEALRYAVRIRTDAADVPVGLLLSGGLDSSLIMAALASNDQQSVHTYSIGFDTIGQEYGDEFEYSDAVIQRYPTQHHKIHIPTADVLSRLPEAIAHMSEPMFGQDAIGFYLLAEEVSKQVKVVLSGQGADEVFGGYFWYPKIVQAAKNNAINNPSDLSKCIAEHYFDREFSELGDMLAVDYGEFDQVEYGLKQLLRQSHSQDPLTQLLYADVNQFIVDDPVKRVDNMTMAFGLEARVPFLDHHLVELAFSMPSELKLAESGKGILKQLARPYLPASVIDRKKGYFPMPALKYVQGAWLNWMRDVLYSDQCQHRGWYKKAYLEQLFSAPEQHFTRIQGSKLWHLTATELWLQQHLDQR